MPDWAFVQISIIMSKKKKTPQKNINTWEKFFLASKDDKLE